MLHNALPRRSSAPLLLWIPVLLGIISWSTDSNVNYRLGGGGGGAAIVSLSQAQIQGPTVVILVKRKWSRNHSATKWNIMTTLTLIHFWHPEERWDRPLTTRRQWYASLYACVSSHSQLSAALPKITRLVAPSNNYNLPQFSALKPLFLLRNRFIGSLLASLLPLPHRIERRTELTCCVIQVELPRLLPTAAARVLNWWNKAGDSIRCLPRSMAIENALDRMRTDGGRPLFLIER